MALLSSSSIMAWLSLFFQASYISELRYPQGKGRYATKEDSSYWDNCCPLVEKLSSPKSDMFLRCALSLSEFKLVIWKLVLVKRFNIAFIMRGSASNTNYPFLFKRTLEDAPLTSDSALVTSLSFLLASALSTDRVILVLERFL